MPPVPIYHLSILGEVFAWTTNHIAHEVALKPVTIGQDQVAHTLFSIIMESTRVRCPVPFIFYEYYTRQPLPCRDNRIGPLMLKEIRCKESPPPQIYHQSIVPHKQV